MEVTTISILLAVMGLCLGSFSGAMVWRLRARQLVEDKMNGEKLDEDEYARLNPLVKVSPKNDRSRCLNCGHTLAWYDLMPLVSWFSTRGKCRYCQEKIGWFEPVIEGVVAMLFVGSYVFWPAPLQSNLQVLSLFLWLAACVALVILFVYDLKWFLLPNVVVFPLMGVAVLAALLHLSMTLNLQESVLSLLFAIFILSGIYLLLWIISKGNWIGFGDIKLGLALALVLGDWRLAFITLFAANLIGCIIVIPGMIAGRISRSTRIPFGPLLIVGAVIAKLFGSYILNWYFSTFM